MKPLRASPVILFALLGCTNLFLQPSRLRSPAVERYGLRVNELQIAASDQNPFQVWVFPVLENQKAKPEFITDASKKPLGLVLQVHGNAENMSTHFQSLAWLPFAGYELVSFDYRGYGASTGDADLDGSLLDTKAAIRYVDTEAGRRGLKWTLVGQSLGGTLGLRALELQTTENLALVVIQSAFHSYREIARVKLSEMWLTWPFQWLPWILISDRFSPAGVGLKQVASGIPIVILHSENDEIVPFAQGRRIFDELREPKELWSYSEAGHINGFDTADRRYRKKLLALIHSRG